MLHTPNTFFHLPVSHNLLLIYTPVSNGASIGNSHSFYGLLWIHFSTSSRIFFGGGEGLDSTPRHESTPPIFQCSHSLGFLPVPGCLPALSPVSRGPRASSSSAASSPSCSLGTPPPTAGPQSRGEQTKGCRVIFDIQNNCAEFSATPRRLFL